MNTTPFEDHLRFVVELNRAFLALLQQEAGAGGSALGMPGGVALPIRAAPSALLDALADFPGALFRLDFARCARRGVSEPGSIPTEAEYHLVSSILHAARGAARQNAYDAQVLFGLVPADVERCRVLTFDGLRRLACSPGLLRCAHAERPWLWHALLGAARPEARRQLALIALQPYVPHGWPMRRPPQPAR